MEVVLRIPPSQVMDLSVTDHGGLRVTLNWTSSRDVGTHRTGMLHIYFFLIDRAVTHQIILKALVYLLLFQVYMNFTR